ncbi:MAG: hypothetical protein WBC51_05005 [Vicinamibacterales bacterium]
MKRMLAVGLIVSFIVAEARLFAVDSNKAQYMGGTVAGLKEKAQGRFSTSAEDAITFTPDGKKSVPVSIPYAAITELEYGQKAGRRVAVGILVSPWALFSKKRNHYLTISYKDAAGKEQAAVFELGKDIVRTTVKILETRSGKDVQYQDDEARKSLGGGKGK